MRIASNPLCCVAGSRTRRRLRFSRISCLGGLSLVHSLSRAGNARSHRRWSASLEELPVLSSRSIRQFASTDALSSCSQEYSLGTPHLRFSQSSRAVDPAAEFVRHSTQCVPFVSPPGTAPSRSVPCLCSIPRLRSSSQGSFRFRVQSPTFHPPNVPQARTKK